MENALSMVVDFLSLAGKTFSNLWTDLIISIRLGFSVAGFARKIK